MFGQRQWRELVDRDAKDRQVDRQTFVAGLGDALEHARQAVERVRLQAAALELMLQRLARQRVLLVQRHAQLAQRRRRLVLDVVARFRQAQADPEFRAFLGNAVDTDLATHLLDQAFGDDQAQARPAGLARQ